MRNKGTSITFVTFCQCLVLEKSLSGRISLWKFLCFQRILVKLVNLITHSLPGITIMTCFIFPPYVLTTIVLRIVISSRYLSKRQDGRDCQVATTQPTTQNNLRQLLLGVGKKNLPTSTMWLHLKQFKATKEADFRYATFKPTRKNMEDYLKNFENGRRP